MQHLEKKLELQPQEEGSPASPLYWQQERSLMKHQLRKIARLQLLHIGSAGLPLPPQTQTSLWGARLDVLLKSAGRSVLSTHLHLQHEDSCPRFLGTAWTQLTRRCLVKELSTQSE